MRYLHLWEPRDVVLVVRLVFTEALGAEDDQLADFQDLIGSAEIDPPAGRSVRGWSRNRRSPAC